MEHILTGITTNYIILYQLRIFDQQYLSGISSCQIAWPLSASVSCKDQIMVYGNYLLN
jgi:hypothetical protein